MGGVHVLPDRLGTDAVEALRAGLDGLSAGGKLDGRAVRMIGALPAQLLVAASIRIARAGGRLEIAASDDMRADLALLGFAPHLNLEGEIE